MTIPHLPPAGQWTPPAAASRRPSSNRIGIPLATVGVLIAVAALVVGVISLNRPTSSPTSPGPAPTTSVVSPSFPDADAAAAKSRVCSTFEKVSKAVKLATSAPDGAEPAAASANARAALVGGAVALSRSASPATPTNVARLAESLADAYLDYVVTAFAEEKADGTPVENATTALRQGCV